MAAKQGTLAQLSQAGEDAKRAVLSRTGVTSSWFSNLNTVCTIKSAPPRSPEVLQMLATKSGWLFKRNEQHVWQVRWCCAVPHTFLYYFDAPPNMVGNGTGSTPVLTQPTQQQQDEWNRAIAKGYGNRKQHEKRSNFYLFNNHNNNTNDATTSNNGHDHGIFSSKDKASAVSYNTAEGDDNTNNNGDLDLLNSNFSASMQPAGIIDLECYTSIHRSSANAHILELAGDDQVNPDLRAFYFCSSSPSECEDWTDALLNGRHSVLLDECDAYKQVCDGFAQQLQMLHSDLDDTKRAKEEADSELYRVRCQLEELRRTVRRLVEDCLERTLLMPTAATSSTATLTTTDSTISGFHHTHQDEHKSEMHVLDDLDGGNTMNSSVKTQSTTPITCTEFDDSSASSGIHHIQVKRMEVIQSLETIHSQDMGVPALVQLLTEYCAFLEDTAIRFVADKTLLEKKLKQTGQSDQQRVEQLLEQLELTKHQTQMEMNQYRQTFETLQTKYHQSQKELRDIQNELNSTRMETTMYQNQQRNKLSELHQHKKILKKEVIDLRAQIEERDAIIRRHELHHETDAMSIEQERLKTSLLEKYIKKVESQVQVQQNMMEMMSQSGMGSVYGGGIGSSGSVMFVGGAGVSTSGKNHQHYSHRNSHSPKGDEGGERKKEKNMPSKWSNENHIVSNRKIDSCFDDDTVSENNISARDEDDDNHEEDVEGVEVHMIRPGIDASFGGSNSNRTAHRRGNHTSNQDDDDDVNENNNKVSDVLRGENEHDAYEVVDECSNPKKQRKKNKQQQPLQLQNLHSPQIRSKQHLIMDNDIDNKSHMSELTEDRTQRHFDAFHHYTSSGVIVGSITPSGNANGVPASQIIRSPSSDDQRRFENLTKHKNMKNDNIVSGTTAKMYSAQSPGPPLHIIGVNSSNDNTKITPTTRSHLQDEDDDDGGTISEDDDNDEDKDNINKPIHSDSRTSTNTCTVLDTINSASVNPSLSQFGSNNGAQFGSNNGVTNGNTSAGRKDFPRGGSGNGFVSIGRSKNNGKVERIDRPKETPPVQIRVTDGINSKSNATTQPKLDGGRKVVSIDKKHASTNEHQLGRQPLPLATNNNSTDNRSGQNINNAGSSSNGSQHSQSLPSGLWRRVEEAVLGSKLIGGNDDDDDNEDDSSYESTESNEVPPVRSNPGFGVDNWHHNRSGNTDKSGSSQTNNRKKKIDMTDDRGDILRNRDNSSEQHNIIRTVRSSPSDSSKAPTSTITPKSTRPLTLQERCQLQREKQLNFLREQGLVREESDIRGGAGAASVTSFSDSVSVASPSRSFLSSFPSKLLSPGST